MSEPRAASARVPALWAIVWKHPQNGWYVWDFVRARQHRKDLFEDLRALKIQHPKDTFRLYKFVMVRK